MRLVRFQLFINDLPQTGLKSHLYNVTELPITGHFNHNQTQSLAFPKHDIDDARRISSQAYFSLTMHLAGFPVSGRL